MVGNERTLHRGDPQMRSTRDMDHEIQLPSKWTISKDAIALENRELSRNNVKYMRNYGA